MPSTTPKIANQRYVQLSASDIERLETIVVRHLADASINADAQLMRITGAVNELSRLARANKDNARHRHVCLAYAVIR